MNAFPDPDDYLVSTLYTGIPGSGKSQRVVRRVVEVVEHGLAKLVCVHDSEEKTIRDIAVQLIARGYGHCIHWDSYRHFGRVLGGLSPQPSADPDPFRRQAIDRQRLDGWKRNLWLAADRAEENGKDIFGMASLNMAAEMGSRLLFYQRDPAKRDFSQFPAVVQLGGMRCRALVDGMEDREETREVRQWYAMLFELHTRRNYRILDEKIGALERLIPQAFTPQFRERLAGEFIVPKLLRLPGCRTQVILIDASDDGSVSPRAVTALTHCWNEKMYEAAQQRYLEIGRPTHMITVLEEMAANRSLGTREIVFLRKGRKLGFHLWGVTQDFAFADEPTREAMTKLFRRKEWHNPGDKEMAMTAGEDLAYRQFDLHLVHSVEQSVKQVRNPKPRTEKRVTTQTSKDHEGNVRTGESVVDVEVYDFDTITEEHTKYVALEDQVRMKAHQALGMGAGQFMVSHMTERKSYFSTRPEYSELLPDAFDEEEEPGLAGRKLARMIQRSQARDYFRTPVLQEPEPCLPPPPPPARAGKPKEGPRRIRGRKRTAG